MKVASFSPGHFLSTLAVSLLAGCSTPYSGDPGEPGTGGRGGSGSGGSSGGRGGAAGGSGGTGGATAGTGGTGGATAGTGGSGTGGSGTGGSGTGGSGTGGSAADGGASDGTSTPAEAGGQPTDPATPGPTDLTKHRYSKVVTMNTTASGAPVPGDVNKYPVAVQLNAMNFDFTQAMPAGEDIRFATAAGALLPYAIESWDSAAKLAAIWVKVDVKGNSNAQSFVMHWGNPTAQSASSGKTVFSAEDGFLGVYHLNEEGTNAPGGYKDSSPTEAHLTGFGMEPAVATPARIGKGTLLSNPGGQGKNQWMGIEGPKVETAFNASAARPITATGWAYGNTFSGYYETVFSKGDTSWTLQRDYQGRMETCTWSGSYHACAITGAPPVKRWVHYMVVQTTSNLTLYVDGRRAAGTGSFNRTGTHGFAIAHNYQANNNAATGRREWDGMIDEVRVMGGAKDANWALLDFHSQKEGSAFLSFGATTMK